MSQTEKLLKRVESLDAGMRFDEIARVLCSCGYEMHQPGRGGSHYTFRKSGKLPITIPKHEPIKRVYVSMVRSKLRKEGLL